MPGTISRRYDGVIAVALLQGSYSHRQSDETRGAGGFSGEGRSMRAQEESHMIRQRRHETTTKARFVQSLGTGFICDIASHKDSSSRKIRDSRLFPTLNRKTINSSASKYMKGEWNLEPAFII